MQGSISRGRLGCSGCTMWQVYTAAETRSAKSEYDDRKRPKPKVWPKNYFYIRPKLNIGRICTTAHIRPPKPKPNFAHLYTPLYLMPLCTGTSQNIIYAQPLCRCTLQTWCYLYCHWHHRFHLRYPLKIRLQKTWPIFVLSSILTVILFRICVGP